MVEGQATRPLAELAPVTWRDMGVPLLEAFPRGWTRARDFFLSFLVDSKASRTKAYAWMG